MVWIFYILFEEKNESIAIILLLLYLCFETLFQGGGL